MRVGYPVRQQLNEELPCTARLVDVQVVFVRVFALPKHGGDRKRDDYCQLQKENSVQHFVHRFHQITDFSGRLFAVLENLCFRSDVETYAIAMTDVFKSATPEEQIFY